MILSKSYRPSKRIEGHRPGLLQQFRSARIGLVQQGRKHASWYRSILKKAQ